jgi:enamine deaminase RidA (YjgF/YER057c/UK114 family)
MPKISPYAAPGVFESPAYAQAIKVEGAQTLLFISGQLDYDAKGGCAHPGDFAGQAKGALAALKAQVEDGGGTMASIVKVNTYLIDMRHRAEFAAIRAEFFGAKMPASTLVAISALAFPDFLIEIEAIAVV